MGWSSALRLAGAILFSLGGGGAVALGLANYFGKLWADRTLEKERHKYATLLQDAKSDLELAASRYQVELDALSDLHRIRTDEEFVRLGQLWRNMAVLQDALRATLAPGLRIVPADPQLAEEYKARLRREYERALHAAHKFFLGEKLFIPRLIAEKAGSTLGYAVKEKNLFDLFATHHECGIRQQYSGDLAEILTDFDNGMDALERLMRGYIAGKEPSQVPAAPDLE